jgi:branched-chain amino acid transport system substrate-binding protein
VLLAGPRRLFSGRGSVTGVPTITRRDCLRVLGLVGAGVASGPLLSACAPLNLPMSSAGGALIGRRGAEPLRVGVLLPAHGPAVARGERVASGFQLYLERTGNRAGGRPVVISRADEGITHEEALRGAQALIDEQHVDFLVGVLGTPAAYAVRDLCRARQTVALVTGAGANDLTRDRKTAYLFRTSFTNWQLSYPLGEWSATNVARRAYLCAADSDFGRESAEAFKDAYTRAGGTVVGESYVPASAADYADVLTRIVQARPEATWAGLRGVDAARFVAAYAAADLPRKTRLLGVGFLTGADVLPEVGRAALGAITSHCWAPTLDNAENRRFREDYVRRFGQEPDVYALQGYDAARATAEALEQTGGDTANREQLVAALAAVQFDSPRGPFRFDPDSHQVIQDVYIREVKEQQGGLVNSVLDRVRGVRDTV